MASTPPAKPPRFKDLSVATNSSSAKKVSKKKAKKAKRVSIAKKKQLALVERWEAFAKHEQTKESAKYVEKIIRYLVKKDEVSDKSSRQRSALFSAMFNILFLMIVGAVFVGLVERWTFLDSIWWSYVTLSTLGFGDKTPEEPVAMWFTSLFIIYGIGQLSNGISTVVSYLKAKKEEALLALHLEEERHERLEREKQMLATPRQGKDMVDQIASGISHAVTQSPRESINQMAMGIKRVGNNVMNAAKNPRASASSAKRAFKKEMQECRTFAYVVTYFIFTLVCAAGFLHLSDGWNIGHGFYFVLTIATTIGYGDQSSLYPLNGKNITGNETTYEECVGAKGNCVVSTVAMCSGNTYSQCSCSFSDASKVFIVLFSGYTFSQLSAVIDSVPVKAFERFRIKVRGKKHAVSPAETTSEEDDTTRNDSAILIVARNCCSLFITLTMVYGYLILGGLIFMTLEPETFSTLLDGIYFSLVTLTTIGYGDFSPSTPMSQMVWGFYMIFGFVFVAKFLGALSSIWKACAKRSTRFWACLCSPFGIGDDEDEVELILLLQTLFNTILFLSAHMVAHSFTQCNEKVDDGCGNLDYPSNCPDTITKLFYSAVVTMSTVGYGKLKS
eukprot:g10645.t1